MKKLFALLSMVAFLAATPVFATSEEKPKAKKEAAAKTDKKSEAKATKDCATPCSAAEKAPCGKEKK
jgi:hypothetical protein